MAAGWRAQGEGLSYAEFVEQQRSQPAPGPEAPAFVTLPIHTWQDAERAAARHMTSLGFAYVRVTAAGADGGIDVTAVGAAAQVKWRTARTSRPELQQLRGAAESSPAQLFYSTGYTAEALTYGTRSGMALFQLGRDGNPVAVSPAANELTRRVNSPAARRMSSQAQEGAQLLDLGQRALVKTAQPPAGWTAAGRERDAVNKRRAATDLGRGMRTLRQLAVHPPGAMSERDTARAFKGARADILKGARAVGIFR